MRRCHSLLAIFLLLVLSYGAIGQPLNSTAPSASPVAAPTDIPAAACNATAFDEKNYNEPWHIGAIFIVLTVSGIGIVSAILISSNPTLRSKQGFLFIIQLLKFFGIGVIVATAWIHLLPDAFDNFSNECLLAVGKWGAYGSNYVGLFGIIASFLIQAIEFCALSRADTKAREKAKKEKSARKDDHEDTDDHHHAKVNLKDPDECDIPHTHSHKHDHKPHKPQKVHDVDLHDVTGHSHEVVASVIEEEEDEAQKDLGTIFLEVGIIFHSIIIGITLGISTTEFKTLMIAICFHQFFEGIALGVRIAEIKRFNNIKKLILGFFYPIMTPIGIAIGIGIRHTFNSNSWKSLLVQGIFDSLSAGILFYNGYVELMAFEMNRNAVFRAHNTLRKFCLFFALYLGAAAMAIIGIWA